MGNRSKGNRPQYPRPGVTGQSDGNLAVAMLRADLNKLRQNYRKLQSMAIAAEKTNSVIRAALATLVHQSGEDQVRIPVEHLQACMNYCSHRLHFDQVKDDDGKEQMLVNVVPLTDAEKEAFKKMKEEHQTGGIVIAKDIPKET